MGHIDPTFALRIFIGCHRSPNPVPPILGQHHHFRFNEGIDTRAPICFAPTGVSFARTTTFTFRDTEQINNGFLTGRGQ